MNASAMIERKFNLAKKTYNQHCYLQKNIGKILISHLKKYLDHAHLLLDLGCGTGLLSHQLLTEFNANTYEGFDISHNLLAVASASNHGNHCYFFQRNFDDSAAYEKKYDLIYSNMALHWSVNLSKTLSLIHDHLTEQGILAFSIPLPGTLHELTNHFNMNSFIDLENIHRTLFKLDFNIKLACTENYIISFTNTLAALRSLKYIGATHVPHRKHNFKGKLAMNNLSISQLTYVIGYFVVEKI